jgi:predicted ATPase
VLERGGRGPLHCPPGSEAVELLVQRAAGAGAEAVTAEAGVVAEICNRLDRLPLAIELAPARTRVLPPGSLLARLDADAFGALRVEGRQLAREDIISLATATAPDWL